MSSDVKKYSAVIEMLCFLVLKCALCWLYVISHLKQLFNAVVI